MLSEHFSRSEFACKCQCGFATVDIELLQLLEAIRERFNKPVTITSGCRCKLHNVAAGGAFASKHLEGIAADIMVLGVFPSDVYKFVDGHAPNKYGLKAYDSWTHVDIRPDKWRG
tara:strand:+ start:3326 stop:3670 length:345 start_codon:yes stop_codon:yes gene_type:complete